MITRTRMNVLGAILAFPFLLWCAAQAFGFGVGFDAPPIPAGAHTTGPAVKGTLTYTVVAGPKLEASLDATCGKATVHVGPLDITAFSDVSAFATATGKQVENFVEGLFLDVNTFGDALNPIKNACYQKATTFFGVVVAAVNKTILKNSTLWVGEVTIQGVIP